MSKNPERHPAHNLCAGLPEQPGVYQFFDKTGKIIYIGKAKNLRKRVSSYFTKKHEYGKLLYLVTGIADIKYIVVDTEADALLLENNLIKKYQPRYNVELKDGKSYPWICIKKETFPRVFQTRNLVRDGSDYFGPYPSLKMMYAVLDLIKKLYPLRTCSLNLSEENIKKSAKADPSSGGKKFRVCLEYHLKNCKGPCEGFQTEEEYLNGIAHIKQILRGNISSVIKQLTRQMWQCAGKYDFENAQLLKEKIALLEKYQSRSVVMSPAVKDADVFSIVSDERFGYVNYLRVLNGALVQSHTLELKKKLNESEEELLLLGITELRQRHKSEAKEIIVPFSLPIHLPEVKWCIPQRGEKKKLLLLSQRNAEYCRREKEALNSFITKGKKEKRILKTVMNDLRLKEVPEHIECFDNSNIQGAWPVSACVVFKNAKPSKKEYRLFNIRTVKGPDDFASLREAVFRRYKRMKEENQPLPQLLVVDGGKGQISAAMKSLKKLGLSEKITLFGIAKRLEEIFRPGDSLPLYLNKKSETLRLLQRMRDEAHRFSQKHHRRRRERESIFSELSAIKGIGGKTAEKLLQTLGSVKQVKETSEEKIAEIVGKKKTKILKDYFTQEN